MRRVPLLVRCLLCFVLWLVAWEGRALAFPACTAGEIIARDGGCASGVGPCSITLPFEIGNGCTLDFQTRSLLITASGGLRGAIATQVASFTVKAGALTIAPGGSVEARGDAASGALADGGTIILILAGDVVVDRASGIGRIDVSGNANAGNVSIVAGGGVTISGRVAADGLTNDAAGGSIDIRAGGGISSTTSAQLSATAGNAGGIEGDIQLLANGAIRLGAAVDLVGESGGMLTIEGGDEVDIEDVHAFATGDGGSGGGLTIEATRRVRIQGAVVANGGPSADGGGCGGAIDVFADRGDISVEADLNVDSGEVDGGAGEISLETRGALAILSNVVLSAMGTRGESCGGGITLAAATALRVDGRLDASGGIGGGTIDMTSGADVILNGNLNADGRGAGACGGAVDIAAGRQTTTSTGAGRLQVAGTIDVSGPACHPTLGCGSGGDVDFEACDVSILSSSRIVARAAAGGRVDVSARHTLSNNGDIDAARTVASQSEGRVTLTYPAGGLVPPDGGDISPVPILRVRELCSTTVQIACLPPCPTCGNGMVEFPEDCDGGNTANCDGCTFFCKTESCSDGRLCTIDLCDPQFGCYVEPAPSPCVEPPTPSPTPSQTRTETATRSATPTLSSTPTITSTPPESFTPTLSPTVSPTSTASPAATITMTPSLSATPTRSATPTTTSTPAIAGDANCDRIVAAADFPALLAAYVSQQNVCGADIDRNGRIEVDDIDLLPLRIFGDR